MLKYETPSGTGEIENSWEELSPKQFIETIALTNRFFAGGFNIDEYRLQLLKVYTGYDRSEKRLKKDSVPYRDYAEISDTINENLFLISEQLTFSIRPKCGPEEVLEFFSPELREQLKVRFPWEIIEPEMVDQLNIMAKRLTVEYELNLNLGKNPIPFIRINETILKGPVFNTSDGDLDTDLKAGMYLDAQEYFTAFTETRNVKYLDLMIMALYFPVDDDDLERHPEFISGSHPISEIPVFTDRSTKDAILLVFMYIQTTLVNDPIFSILFNSASTGSPNSVNNKLSLGPDEAIGQLIEAGYGSHESILNLDIRTFFNFQIMMIKKNVNQLRSYDKKPGEIASELNLPIETIQKL
ncbi:MAG: hypothetical protein JZU49_00060 [Sulfuricurvum sp.]|nr:hypothetical protein [Sulfuricurvum sp.]